MPVLSGIEPYARDGGPVGVVLRRPPLAGLPDGADVEERVLERSYPVATLDHDAPLVVDGSLDFDRPHSGADAVPLGKD